MVSTFHGLKTGSSDCQINDAVMLLAGWVWPNCSGQVFSDTPISFFQSAPSPSCLGDSLCASCCLDLKTQGPEPFPGESGSGPCCLRSGRFGPDISPVGQ